MSPRLGCIRRASVRQIKLLAAIETNLVSPAFDGEDPAQVAMTTAEGELENPTQRVHPSYLQSRLAGRMWPQPRFTHRCLKAFSHETAVWG
jgi:hypothetical protein